MRTHHIASSILVLVSLGCGNSAVSDVGGAAKSVSGSSTAGALASADGALGTQVTSALGALKGKTLTDTTGALGGGDWTVGDFGVVKDVAGGKDPVLAVAQNEVTKYLPISTEGDAADIVTRVTGAASPVLKSGGLSPDYQKAIGLVK